MLKFYKIKTTHPYDFTWGADIMQMLAK